MSVAKLKDCFGESVLNKQGGEVKIDDLADMPVAIYFSAHWCPPCRGFTPVLTDFYNRYKDAGKKFEIIFVTSDRDQASFDAYYGEMPWLTIGFGSDKSDHIKQTFNVRGIPYLVVIKPDGSISTEGRGEVMGEQSSKTFPWE